MMRYSSFYFAIVATIFMAVSPAYAMDKYNAVMNSAISDTDTEKNEFVITGIDGMMRLGLEDMFLARSGMHLLEQEEYTRKKNLDLILELVKTQSKYFRQKTKESEINTAFTLLKAIQGFEMVNNDIKKNLCKVQIVNLQKYLLARAESFEKVEKVEETENSTTE